MKNILFYLTIALCSLSADTHASETPTSIPCHIINEIWPEKTRLTGIVTYSNQHTEEVSLLIDGTTTESQRIQQRIDLPYGLITEFNLFLNHYHEESDNNFHSNDVEETLAGSMIFKPKQSFLKEITLTLDHLIIRPTPIYVFTK